MAYFSSAANSNRQVEPASESRLERLSLLQVKGLALSLLVGIVLILVMLWQPTYQEMLSLQREQSYWQQVSNQGVAETKHTIPTLEQLPDMVDLCRSAFVKVGVDVMSLNVEQFGERQETEKGASLDYSLVRMQLQGSWQGIATSLKTLEENKEVSVQVQEVTLNEDGGETLLRIFFSTGE